MDAYFTFTITHPIAEAFQQRGIHNFYNALQYVRHLPYGRNPDKERPLCVLEEGNGTCSTKHALLARLAATQGHTEVQLCMGIYRMTALNTPPVAPVLQQYGLAYIPEAHNYLCIAGQRLDCTRPSARPEDFVADLLQETVISPEQVTTHKVAVHQAYIRQWLAAHPDIPYPPDQLWSIREACIQALENA